MAGTVSVGRPTPKVSEETIRSPRTERSTAPVNDSLRPLKRIVTKTTSPTPIISAAAVTAVRPVLRVVFSIASLPEAPRRPTSRPTNATTGRTRYVAISATPMKNRIAPPATPSSSRVTMSPSPATP